MKRIPTTLAATLLAGAVAAQASTQARPTEASAEKAKQDVVRQQLPTYPLDVCPVSGEPLHEMGDPIDWVYEGHLVRLCCKSCVKGFKKNPDKVLKKIEQAVIAQQKPSYPLDTCVVSGEPLGEMGDPIDVVYGTRLVRFCCKSCTKKLKKDPAAILKKLDAAYIAAQRPNYPLSKCLVSGEPLGDSPVDVLYGNRLFRFCCKKCAKKLRSSPDELVSRLDEAAGKPTKKKVGAGH